MADLSKDRMLAGQKPFTSTGIELREKREQDQTLP